MPYREIEAQSISQVAQFLGITHAQFAARWSPAGISGTARIVKPAGFKGSVGFISPIGEHFCDSCNRLRLSSDGQLHACLLEEGSVDLRSLLRSGKGDEEIMLQMQAAATLKPLRHRVTSIDSPEAIKKMSRVGG
jgi:cyclic pyranopterin phosphate synthase